MRYLLYIALLFISDQVFAQVSKLPNIFIITTDGFRWQEVFSGADKGLIQDTRYVKDTSLLSQLYWNDDVNERRKMLLPFIWKVLSKQGSLYGNRGYNNKVSVANPYRFSYAGYNEIFTGHVDNAIIANSKRWNKNENILDLLNEQLAYKGKVAAFTSWNLFPYIFNSRNSRIYLNSGYQTITADSLTTIEQLVNGIQDSVIDNTQACRNDMLTFIIAKTYIQKQHPKVAYISFGETDEHAHDKDYDDYLQSAHAFDDYLSQFWYMVNTDPFYKNNTIFIVTTDHGRGQKSSTWYKHGPFISGSNETWMMTIGPNLTANGEVKVEDEIFNEQIARTVTKLLDIEFTGLGSIALPIYSMLEQ